MQAEELGSPQMTAAKRNNRANRQRYSRRHSRHSRRRVFDELTRKIRLAKTGGREISSLVL